MLQRVALDPGSIASNLAELSGWSVAEGLLQKEFSFKNYAAGALFVASIATQAEKLDHHPNLLLGYCKVKLSVNTHDVGGITDWDFELARRAEAAYHPG